MNADTREIIRVALDRQVVFQRDARGRIHPPARGWLRAIRNAIGIKQETIAKRAGMSRQAYAQLENAEVARAITLRSLERAAEAMDCELVYFLVPKNTVADSYTALAQIHDPAFRSLHKSEHTMALEGQAVGDLPSLKGEPPTGTGIST